jgi:hypothetical protein
METARKEPSVRACVRELDGRASELMLRRHWIPAFRRAPHPMCINSELRFQVGCDTY